MTDLRYRNIYVACPRAVMSRWQHEPWDIVLQAAERGEDGLAVRTGRPRLWQGPQMGACEEPDVAFLTQGQFGAWEKKTVLHQQNWTEVA